MTSQQQQQTFGHVVKEVIIDSRVQPLNKGLNISSDQSPLVSQTEATQQSESDGVQSQQERTLIDEGVFSEESSSNNVLQNYQLTFDPVHRVKHAPTTYGFANLVSYAFNCAVDNIKAKPKF